MDENVPSRRPTDIVGLASLGQGTEAGATAISKGRSPLAMKPPPHLSGPFLATPVGCGPSAPKGSSGSGGAYDSDLLAKLFWKWKHTTVTYCFLFWAFGMCVAFLGPTLRDLGCKTGSMTATMSWIFFSQALFILIGSAVGGFIIQKFPVNLVLFVSTLMLALTLSLIPFCNVIYLLALVMAIMGFFMGTIDTIANISMINLYGKSVAPFLQTLHFFYGLGAFVSPMIAEPFLLNENCNFLIDNSSTSVLKLDNDDLEINGTGPAETLSKAQQMTHVDYAFWIMALLQIPVICMVSSLLLKHLYDTTVQRKANLDEKSASKLKEDYESVEMETKDQANCPETLLEDDYPLASKTQVYAIAGLTASLLFLYDGLQASYGGYIFSYASQNIAGMSSSEAAYINSYYWGMFAFGRLISIIIATKMSPGMMLLFNILGCIFSMVLLLIWSHNRIALYIGTCVFGAFLSSIYPTAVSLAEKFIKITSGIASFIVVGAAAGEMMFPVIVGHQFDEYPINFLVMGFVVTLFSLFVYGAIRAVGSTILRTQGAPGFFGALLSLVSIQPSEGGSEETGLVSRHVKYYSRMRNTSESNDGDADQDDVNYGEAIEINHEDYRRP